MAKGKDEYRLGGTYVVRADIADIPCKMAGIFEEGALLVVYDIALEDEATELMSGLKGAYRVFEYKALSARRRAKGERVQNDAVPEYVRHILAVGAGSAAEEARRLAEALDIDWSLVLSAPSADGLLRRKPPKAVFICKELIDKAPFECLAAGYGMLFSQPFNRFERFYGAKVAEGKASENKEREYREPEPCELAEMLLEDSLDRAPDSADIAARILFATAVAEGRTPRLIGEYRFIAATAIAAVYSVFLSSICLDIMPPPSYGDEAEAAKLLSDGDIHLKRVDFFDINGYFRMSYILNEYRMDLLDKLSGSDLRGAKRFFRRTYPDAGYSLKNEITCKEVGRAVYLAGAKSDGLLGYAYASGVLDRLR